MTSTAMLGTVGLCFPTLQYFTHPYQQSKRITLVVLDPTPPDGQLSPSPETDSILIYFSLETAKADEQVVNERAQ